MFKNTYSAQRRRIHAFAKVWTKAYLAACAEARGFVLAEDGMSAAMPRRVEP
jgi:hypothetical protein